MDIRLQLLQSHYQDDNTLNNKNHRSDQHPTSDGGAVNDHGGTGPSLLSPHGIHG